MSHKELLERHRKVLPNWVALNYEQPIALVDGEGRHVVDAEGNRYLDFFGGILTTMLGYNLPEIVEVVREQAGKMAHTSTLYLIESSVELAERIAALSGIPDAKVFLTPSGTDANEAALLLATVARRSNQVLTMRNSYHGRSFGAVGVTGNRSWSPTSFNPLSVTHVLGAYRYRSQWRDLPDDEYVRACLDDLRDVLATAIASGDVACLIAEPIQGVGGFSSPPDGLYGAMQREILADRGILYVTDEVQTGWGRTGEHYWGYQAHGVQPDMLTFAKGIANGLALGGVVARAELMDGVTANGISTFGGSPLAARTALATLDYLEAHDLQANALKQGSRLLTGLREVAESYPVLGDVRGKGLMIGCEFVEPGTTTPAPAVASRVMEETRSRGLLAGKGGLHGNCLRMGPPLSLTDSETEEGLGILADAIAAASS
jgi:4-aminobutyrate aminotransferase